MATSEMGKVVVGIVIIVIGVVIINGKTWDTSPIPGIDFKWSRTVVMIGFVLAMFPVIKSFFLTPLKEAIDSRNADLEKTFTDAEDLRNQMKALERKYKVDLLAAEASAREQIQAQVREAQALRQTLMTEAAQKADVLLKQAQDQIEQEKIRAINEIRTSVVDLTFQAVEKVIGENLNDARNRQLVEDFIAGVQVAR